MKTNEMEGPSGTFKLLFRLSVLKRINSDEYELHGDLLGRGFSLKAVGTSRPLREASDLIFEFDGFQSEADAWLYAAYLRKSLVLAFACSNSGIVLWEPQDTSGPTPHLIDLIRDETGLSLGRNIGGATVVPSSGGLAMFGHDVTLSVSMRAAEFIDAIRQSMEQVERLLPTTYIALEVMNGALAAGHPVAQAILAVSAVESLVDDVPWSEDQRSWLRRAEDAARSAESTTEEEGAQLADAISNLRARSVNRGVMDLLDRAKISDRVRELWSKFYSKRSGLVHGRDVGPGADYAGLSASAIPICAHIVFGVAAAEGVALPYALDDRFPLPSVID